MLYDGFEGFVKDDVDDIWDYINDLYYYLGVIYLLRR
jgi:hypothetical protein